MGFFKNLIGGITGKSAKKAAKAQAQAFQTAQQRQEEVIDRITPQVEAGERSLALFGDALGINGPEAQSAFFRNFQNDPGFEAELEGGIEAIDRSSSASLLRNSGGAAKALFDFGRRSKRGLFSDRINRLGGLASFGQAATGQLQGGTNALANSIVGEGTARASGIIGGANAATGFTTGLLGTAANLAGRTAAVRNFAF